MDVWRRLSAPVDPQAIAWYREAIKRNPNHLIAVNNLAYMLATRGRTDELNGENERKRGANSGKICQHVCSWLRCGRQNFDRLIYIRSINLTKTYEKTSTFFSFRESGVARELPYHPDADGAPYHVSIQYAGTGNCKR
jgi:hypothetical protein